MPVSLPTRSTVAQRTHLAVETTAGTQVTPAKRMPNFMIVPEPHFETKEYRGQGFKYPTAVVLGKEWTVFKVDGPMTYGELIYLFASLGMNPTPTSLGSGAYQWVFQPNVSTPDTYATYTMEHGDPNYSVKFGYALVADGTFTVTRDECKVSGSGIAQQWVMTSQVQTLTFGGTVTGGTFTITVAYNGTTQTTSAIAYNASAATVLAALQLLTNVTSGAGDDGTANIAVGGGPGPTAYTLTWGGQFAGYNMPLVSINAASLTGTSPTLTPTITTVSSLNLVNAVQTLTETGTPTGGTFTATFGGITSAAIAYNATAATIQAALVAMASIGAGNVLCGGGPLNTTPVTVTFQANLGGQSVTLMTVNSAGLTGGASPAVTPTTTTAGAPTLVENVPVIPNQVSLYIDTSAANIGTTLVPTEGFSLELTIGGRYGPIFPLNATYASFAQAVELVPKLAVKLQLQADSLGESPIAAIRKASTIYLQLKAVGAAIGGGNSYQLILNLPLQIAPGGALTDLAGVYIATFDTRPIADPNLNYAWQASIINKTSAL